MPQFTIGIPVFNRLVYFKDTLQSVLNQTFTDLEIVIVDDFSTDGTREYLDTLKDARIRIFKNDTNIGIVRNWRKCIEYAGGKWFKFLMSDDIMFPYNLQAINDLIIKYPENFVIITSGKGFTQFDQIGNNLNKRSIELGNTVNDLKQLDAVIEQRKRFNQTWANPAAYTLLTSDLKELVKTESYEKVEEKYGNTGHCVDYFILYSIAQKYRTLIEMDVPLYGIRYHESNLSKGYSSNLFYHLNGDRFIHYLLYRYKGLENFYIIRHAFRVYWHKIKNKREILTLRFIIKGFQLIGFIFYHFFLLVKKNFNKNSKKDAE